MRKTRYDVLNVPNEFKLEVIYSLTTKPYKGCILCVPGICHGAWCFENLLEFFPKHGFDCFALSFRGHAGSQGQKNLNSYKLSDYSEDVNECIEYCLNTAKIMKSAPFLLGHSMGGAVVQKYMGEHFDKLKGAILFAPATAPKMCFCKTLITTFFNYHLFFASLVAYGCKKDWIIKNSAFFTGKDKNGKRVQRIKDTNCFQLLQKESLKVIFISLHSKYTHNRDINIPILVIGSYADLYFSKRSLKKTAKFYRCSEEDTEKHLEILPELCHDMMLDPKWEESANAVLNFMENNK